MKWIYIPMLLLLFPGAAHAATCWSDGDATVIVVGDQAGDMNGDFPVGIDTWEGVRARCSWFNNDETFEAPRAPATIDCNLGEFDVRSVGQGSIAVADMQLLTKVDCDGKGLDEVQSMIADLLNEQHE